VSATVGGRAPVQTKTVLVVDDEPTIRETVAYNFKREGWNTVVAANGLDALSLARELKPDVVVLDIMLPGMDGFQVCRTLRAESTIPILLLSARGEEVDRILGLELGGDDYLTKPFAMRELIARVRAMLRRADMAPATGQPAPAREETPPPKQESSADNQILRSGELSVDVARRTVRLGNEPIALKPKEFDLLAYLMRHTGLVLSRDALLREVWGYDYPVDTRTIDVHIRWLRIKLRDDPNEPRWITTVRGYGYRFVGDGS
jgi:DNA-binding response OmpR family regulator